VVGETLQAIWAHHHPAPHVIAALTHRRYLAFAGGRTGEGRGYPSAGTTGALSSC
jgi:hypothetical protein